MRRSLINSALILLYSWSGTFPAWADIVDIDVFKPKDDRDELLIDKLKKHRDYERQDIDDGDDSDGDDRRDILKDRWTSDFTDTDFSKESFRGLRDDPKEAVFDNTAGEISTDTRGGADGRADARRDRPRLDGTSDSLIGAASEGAFSGDDDDWMRLTDYRKKQIKERDERRMKSLEQLIPDMLQDWVPSKVDRLQNGGFATASDNGFPVPYTLNGWIDIQRDFPWGGQP